MNVLYSAKVVFVLLALSAAGSFVNFQGPADKDRKRLQGKWEVASIVSKAGKEEFKPGQMVCNISGDKIASAEGDAGFTLDASKSPRTIDLRGLTGEHKGKAFLGIYEFNGTEFKMCVGPPNGARPTEFVPSPNQSLIILKRM